MRSAVAALDVAAYAVPEDPDRKFELMTRELSAARLRKCARRLLMIELEKLPRLKPMDERDWPCFIEAITGEHSMQHKADQWPAVVYEEYSPDTPQPRSAEIIEALQFFLMTDRTAIILDSEPWTRGVLDRKDPRKGHTAVLLVF